MVSDALLGFVRGFSTAAAAQQKSEQEKQNFMDKMNLQNYYEAKKLEQQFGYSQQLQQERIAGSLLAADRKNGLKRDDYEPTSDNVDFIQNIAPDGTDPNVINQAIQNVGVKRSTTLFGTQPSSKISGSSRVLQGEQERSSADASINQMENISRLTNEYLKPMDKALESLNAGDFNKPVVPSGNQNIQLNKRNKDEVINYNRLIRNLGEQITNTVVDQTNSTVPKGLKDYLAAGKTQQSQVVQSVYDAASNVYWGKARNTSGSSNELTPDANTAYGVYLATLSKAGAINLPSLAPLSNVNIVQEVGRAAATAQKMSDQDYQTMMKTLPMHYRQIMNQLNANAQ